MDLQKSIRCQTEVALSITKHLFSKEEYQEKNLVFSPFSLHAILSVMAVGSAGSTLDELFSFLRFDSVDHLNTFFSQVLSTVLSDTTPSFLLSFVNEMWADKSLALSHSFKQLMTTHYKATLALVDFRTKGDQVCREVNSWVEKETNGLITELLPTNAVHKLTKLIFANALYFKGVWKHTFDPSMTFVDDFHLLNGTSIEVPFMSSEKKTQFIRTFDGFNVLRLSYKQGRDKKLRFSMCIFLPNAKDGLPSLIEKLASESCFLKGKLPRQKVRVRKFRIPKFKICFELEASNVLKELGVVSPFSKSNANFTKMVVSPLDELCVESIHHKASIEVNEEGTEAGVACSMCDVKLCVSARTGIDFVADHPFLFLIREDLTGTILFIGQVLHPEGAAMSLKEEDSETEYLNMLRDRTRMGRKEEAKAMRTAMLSLRFPPKRKRRQNLVNLILNRRRIKKFA